MATRILTLLFISFFAEAQHKANFKAAEKFSQENLSKMLKSTKINFLKSSKFIEKEFKNDKENLI